jgi:hypothetical protein
VTSPEDLEYAEAMGHLNRMNAEVARLLVERDLARGLAVRLEQECAEQLARAAQRIADYEASLTGRREQAIALNCRLLVTS